MNGKTDNRSKALQQKPRDQKRADALRKNLLKRKQQARSRKEEK